jgi:hypothetical protein
MKAQSDKRELLKLKADRLTEAEISEVLEYIAVMQAMYQKASEPERFLHALAGAVFKVQQRPKEGALQH